MRDKRKKEENLNVFEEILREFRFRNVSYRNKRDAYNKYKE
jgi:hypothetical protein